VKSIRLNKQRIHLSIPTSEEEVMDYEFKSIFYDDCYGLRKLQSNMDTIVDIGGNIGFFSMTARSRFPNAVIHTYEPNPNIQEYLFANLKDLNVKIFPEAVGLQDGTVKIDFGDGSLFSKTKESKDGGINKTSFQNVLKRMDKKIDLLKIDCEGAEWDILQDVKSWQSVNNLAMEYHLWARQDCSLVQLVQTVKELGFRITSLHESPKLEWGIIHATRS
jgi:FkbM family methyltransferase